MKQPYSSPERNVQIIIAVLKAHGIRRVIASPGSTNIAVVGSMQNDPFFEMYSCVDERSAAYMACGMAVESGEPVILSCTGATASRNYYPGLTEAYYRKLPIIALTSSQDSRKFGHLKDQITDRSNHPSDIVNMSVCLQNVRDNDDEWDVTIKANKAVLELFHRGGGPVHINIETTHNRSFMQKDIKPVRIIHRYSCFDSLPRLPEGRIGVFIGSHSPMSRDLTCAIDNFCKCHNAVVFGEPNNGYDGNFRITDGLICRQRFAHDVFSIDLLIHLGEIATFDVLLDRTKQVWRVCEDGELRDRGRHLSTVFEMNELDFFTYYSQGKELPTTFYNECLSLQKQLLQLIPELPFSNIWVASQLYSCIPEESTLCLGILSPLRSWSFFPIPHRVRIDSNQGGFGIDGNMSTMIGASQIHKDRLYFAIVGDLSFFYDMNSLGNRHVGNNVRILLVNNGDGCEFQLDSQMGKTLTRKETDAYISAGGHYGKQSKSLVREYAHSLGFDYLTASTKEEFFAQKMKFLQAQMNSPMIFEIFTQVDDENDALNQMCSLINESVSSVHRPEDVIKHFVHRVGRKLTKL